MVEMSEFYTQRGRENLLGKEFIKLNHQLAVILIYTTNFSQAWNTKSWICCINNINININNGVQ